MTQKQGFGDRFSCVFKFKVFEQNSYLKTIKSGLFPFHSSLPFERLHHTRRP